MYREEHYDSDCDCLVDFTSTDTISLDEHRIPMPGELFLYANKVMRAKDAPFLGAYQIVQLIPCITTDEEDADS